MWYAASEIIFFLLLAAGLGGLIGYGSAQIYQLDFDALRHAIAERKGSNDELAGAEQEIGWCPNLIQIRTPPEIADLKRRLQIVTDALRGDTAPPQPPDRAAVASHVSAPPLAAETIDQPGTGDDSDDDDDGFPPVPSAGHSAIDAAEPVSNPGGRRLSERVADATGS